MYDEKMESLLTKVQSVLSDHSNDDSYGVLYELYETLENYLLQSYEPACTHEMKPLNLTDSNGVQLCFCKKCKQVFVNQD